MPRSKSQPQPPPYETADLYLASLLATSGCPLVGTRPQPDRPRAQLFLFGEPEKAKAIARRWILQEDIQVSAIPFSAQVKRLKSIAMAGGI